MPRPSLTIGIPEGQMHTRRAEKAVERLKVYWPETAMPLRPISPTGYLRTKVRGDFLMPVLAAVREKRLDMAICALKDLPAQLPSGLFIGAVSERGEVREAIIDRFGLVTRPAPGLRLGVLSPLQAAQAIDWQPKCKCYQISEGISALLRNLDADKDLDAVIAPIEDLALMGMTSRISAELSLEKFLPTIGSGVTAVVCRIADRDLLPLLRFFNNEPTELMIRAERAFLRELEGDVQLPLGALAIRQGHDLHLAGALATQNGTQLFRIGHRGRAEDPETAGEELANQFVLRGSRVIAAEIATPAEEQDN